MPAAPPSSSPVGSHTSGRRLWVAKKASSADDAGGADGDQDDAAVGEQPERDPAVAHVDELDAGEHAVAAADVDVRRARAPSSPGRRPRPRAASAAARAAALPEINGPGRSGPTMMPPPICSTMIATIGVRSSGPICSGRRRNRLQERLRDVAQEVHDRR